MTSKLFVRNVRGDITEQEVREVFAPAGTVLRVDIKTPQERPAFAFVVRCGAAAGAHRRPCSARACGTG